MKKKIVITGLGIALSGCGSITKLMDKMQGKLTPEGEKVKIVYAETGNEFIEEGFSLKKLPAAFKKCKALKELEALPYRAGMKYYEQLTKMSENGLRNEAGKVKGANTVMPIMRTAELGDGVLNGTVKAKAFNCPESVRKCKMLGNCNYRNTASLSVNRTWRSLVGNTLKTNDKNLAMSMTIRNDARVIFLNLSNKSIKPLKIESGTISADGPYGRDRKLIIMGDREIDPRSSSKLSAAMNLQRTTPICGTSSGRMIYGKPVTTTDDRFCVGEKFELNLKYRIGSGARKTVSIPFKLAGRTPLAD